MSDRIRTEDTGKIFERAGCLAFDTPYDGHYRYGEPPEHLVERLLPLLYNGPWKHCASGGCRYDFVNTNNEYLSFKTTKGTMKVAPQVIGQASLPKFCEIIGMPFVSTEALKVHIRDNMNSILSVFEEYTFDCPIVYYNEKTSKIKYIKQTGAIDWSQYDMSWSNEGLFNEELNPTTGSPYKGSTYGIQPSNGGRRIPICEIQFHETRPNMANRWSFENLLRMFPNCFEIIEL
tara:strand:+ start:1676 stop:2374 length:699 start_codon:yes stop_codon:yes gene_type:complete